MASTAPPDESSPDYLTTPHPSPSSPPNRAPLAVLPLPMILRSLVISTVSSSKLLLPPALGLMSILASAHGPVLNPDRNPLLRFIVKKTFYAQFCAGETHDEVVSSIANLKKLGFSGIILNYAKEIEPGQAEPGSRASEQEVHERAENEVHHWFAGTMETVRLAQPGDFVSVKFTGAGSQALSCLAERKPPPPLLAEAIDTICALAVSRGVRLLVDAEQASIQAGIDDWTLACMRKYNTDKARAPIFNTYQAYLKSCAATLSGHLRAARDEGFVLGVKLVRGAYIESDPRHLIHDTKEGTDVMFDAISQALLTRRWNDTLEGDGVVPESSLVIATHNAESVRLGRDILERGNAAITDVVFAQLQGMADEVSCDLVTGPGSGDVMKVEESGDTEKKIKAYKYMVWGSTGECMKYLLRRAYENRDAVSRTRDGRDAMWWELVRRMKVALGR